MTELALIASDPAALDTVTDPAALVVRACEQAKAWLVKALDHGEIEQIVELKSQAEAIRAYTMSRQLGRDAELSASEIVRRAERGIGVAIRRGQEAGEIRKSGYRRAGSDDTRLPPDHYFAHPRERSDTYAITDGVTDEEFDDAVESAKSEENLSRANVLRKVRGEPAHPTTESEPGRSVKKRRPITDVARDAGWALRKDVEKIERIFVDARYGPNKTQVAVHLHGHLIYAVDALQRMVDHLAYEGD